MNDNPNFFYQYTRDKWVKYNGKWFTPEEWVKYHHANAIIPHVEWYHDIFEVMEEAKKVIFSKPTSDNLKRYFAFEERILKYYQWRADIGQRFAGRPEWNKET